ncbi:paired amphipathic helix repeat domain-containing protein [Pochonia chlamydosporia 170]|uniref:Paired amphipathic helix repeat domain-containing protein n=1 Tax=Pochonia chlamydosporia 170 TaxID=1380566 RepID=A0A179FB24_METCM|nr:paired amphipathic helix repeat domain-containing protein [Pochonia chlamydosporia 170]OAQ62617.1 paired amphipathic helix repeat domain-containing protein [Pochonia chlamydosporia 170]
MNNQNLHGRSGGPPYDRDREMDDRHRAMQQHEDMRRDQERERERERDREREQADRYQQGPGVPHQSSAGSIPIHQPVASRIPGAIHSPGGLLANHSGNPPPPGASLGAPSGPVNFGGPLQQSGAASQQHQMYAPIGHSQAPPSAGQPAPASAAGFGGPQAQQQPGQQDRGAAAKGAAAIVGVTPGGHQIPGGITQGQQPILNDALTYLDQVKVQFHDQPDVYNRFLDIMKDFKSQAIDTPGVINRVSELFAGHPNLIQGFNTFLPPGYRIECGAGNDPNTIRVTTPMGTTVQSIAGRGQGEHGGPGMSQPLFPERGSQWQQQQPPQSQQQQQQQRSQHSIESPEANFSTPVQNGASLFVQAAAQSGAFDAPGSSQRNAAQGQPGAANAPGSRQTPGPTSGPGGANVGAGNQANMERRGPVEFNHAISYVNKIKNRFQDKPEIYKQFLEILQTYQREQKPIQDVYAQVTTLFNAAPDLLEDFKQFLPESAGQAKATPGRGDDGAPAGPSHTPQPGGQKMPPLGSFAPPPSASKDNKKRPRGDKQAAVAEAALPETNAVNRLQQSVVNGTGKRTKVSHARATGDPSTIEPTLTPVMPEPYPPRPSATSNQEEIAFFERVKKFLSNRSSMNEFLKLCNLFSQGIIDRNTLFHKGALFIGANPDLMTFWKTFVGVDSQDVVIENQPAPPTEKLSLSNCRGYGPSYRLLPKRERLKPCSGRDELCHSVLNDQWASHPTWASEDSGFVAHRKNQFEEGLHRIEEERHDYDFNIEANLKCIQLLEPIAQQMLAMSAAERESFHMPAALAGQSTSIFKRICKKIYGERGIDVVNDMYSHPFDVVPVLLARMRQKDEEWRFSQREWEKVWHAQTENMHLKSLDHMGILVKSTDKRNLTAKHLVDVIKTKHEEQRRERALKGKAPRHQLVWDFNNKQVILQLLRLMMLYSMHNGQHSTQEKERILDFFETFVPAFFDLPEEMYQDKLPKMQPDSGEDDNEDSTPAELTNGRSRRNGKKGDLLRGVLDPVRNGSKPRSQKEDSAASGSKETTPDVTSANEEEMGDAPEEAAVPEVSNERWMPTIPKPVVVGGDNALLDEGGELKADGFFTRPWYNFFCNQTIYVFFNIFQTLYNRLLDIKESHELVSQAIERLNRPKPARDIGFTENHMTFFEPTDDPEMFWPKTVELIEEYITGEVDENRYQDVLRHYYLKNGWKLYTIQDLLKTLCRLALTCSSTDAKEKTPDLIHQYLTSREKEETSYQTEISARKFAEKCVKDGDIFVICWFPQKNEATVRWLQRDETTFYMDEMQVRERWQYYISSFIRVEPTEGIPRSRLQKVVLTRNLPSGDTDSDSDEVPKPLSYNESLTTSICLKSSKMVWGPGTSEYFIYDQSPKTQEERERREKFTKALSAHRESKLVEKMVHNPSWTKDMSPEEVQEQNKNFRKWMDDGVAPPGGDVEMD